MRGTRRKKAKAVGKMCTEKLAAARGSILNVEKLIENLTREKCVHALNMAVRGTMMTREKITWTGNESYILTGPLHSLIFTLVIPSLHTYTHPKMYKLTSNRALNNNVYIYFAYACHTHTNQKESYIDRKTLLFPAFI